MTINHQTQADVGGQATDQFPHRAFGHIYLDFTPDALVHAARSIEDDDRRCGAGRRGGGRRGGSGEAGQRESEVE